MPEKIVVIGSNSFSGASFMSFAQEKGFEVIGISRSPLPDPVFLPRGFSGKQMEFHQLDLNHDLDRIMSVIDSKKPEYVVNFAAQGMVAQSWEHPDHWFMTNVVSTVRLHDRLRHCGFLKKYVHVSTPEVYGSSEGYIQESTSYHPSTPYAVSRAAADMSLHTFFASYRFPVVFTRAANVYGPGQQLYRIIPRTILFIKMKKKLPLHGGGTSERSFIHMQDVSDATLRIMRQALPGEIFHIATKNSISIRNLVELICGLMNVRFEDHVEVAGERLGKDSAYLLDSTKVRKTFGWQDNMSLREGVLTVRDWVEKNFDVLKQQPIDYIHKP
ncbi:MAG: NAD-dependent epimerase/dehydratase family protein [Nitrospinaceae bacterium]